MSSSLILAATRCHLTCFPTARPLHRSPILPCPEDLVGRAPRRPPLVNRPARCHRGAGARRAPPGRSATPPGRSPPAAGRRRRPPPANSGAKTGSSPSRRPVARRRDQLRQDLPLREVPASAARPAHHVAQRDALEQRALGPVPPARSGRRRTGAAAPSRTPPRRADRRGGTNRPIRTLVSRLSATCAPWPPS